jgi:hypothetical protein
LFGADVGLENYSCFCEGPSQVKNFCSNKGIDTYVGCYEDDEFDPDFEKLLSSNIYKPQECLDLAWGNGYMFAGI